MARKADGSIIIDTEIETDGFKAGKKEVESAARNMAKSISQIGDSARITLEKQVNAFVKQNQMYDQQAKKVDELKKKLDELKDKKVPAEQYAKLEKKLLGVLDKIEQLEKSVPKALSGLSVKQFQKKIAELKKEFNETTAELEKMDAAFSELDKKQSEIKEANPNADISGLENEYNLLLDQYEGLQDRQGAILKQISDINKSIKFPEEIEKAKIYAGQLEEKLQSLENSGKAYTEKEDVSKAEEKYLTALQKQQQMHAALGTSYDALKVKVKSLDGSLSNLGDEIQNSDDNYEKLRIAMDELQSQADKLFNPFQRLKDAFTLNGEKVSGYDKLDASLNELKDTAGRVSDSIRNAFESIKESPSKAILSLGDSVLDIGNKMNSAVVSAMGNAVEKTGEGIGKIVGLFKYMGHSVGSAISSSMSIVKEKMAGLAGDIINTVMHPIETIKNVSSSVSASIGTVFENVKEKAAGVAASLINGIAHPLQTLKGSLSVLSKAASLLKSMGIAAKNVSASIGKTLVSGLNKVGSAAKTAAGFIGKTLVSALKKAKSGMQDVDKQTTKTKTSFSTFGRRIKELFLSALIFNRISSALNSMVNGTKEGLNNLVMYSDRVNKSMSILMSSMTRLKNSFATAFAPILNVVAPILSKFIDLISEAATKVGMFFAALTGQKTFEKAIAVQQDYRESISNTTKEQKKANKEQDKYLSGLDEIRRWESNKDEDEEDELLPEDMFTTVPVENSMLDLADKVKDIFSKIFAPLKEAWSREGKFVMDSWKYALKEVWKLAKDIGRDFLKVWNQEATIDMLADMLHIIGDIGLIVGNLAGKFREAWNYNNTGLHILENIRDIFAVIVHNIREAADYTVEWTKTLDFRPLLTSIENVTRSLIRFADFVSGTLADFYTEFILPLTSWSLSEQGLPRLLNILASFMDSVNWEGLRESLKSLYQALEPYAEEIGNGLIDFIEKMKDEGVEFFNFLPGAIQRAADALRAGDLPAAFYEFGSIAGEAVRHAFNTIRTAIDSIPWGEIGTSIASFINGIPWDGVLSALFGSITSAINGALELAHNFIMTADWISLGKALGENLQRAWDSIDWHRAGETIGNGIRGIFDFLLATVQEIDWGQIGRDIGDFLSAIPWGDIFDRVFEVIGTVFGGLLEGLKQSFPGRILATITEMIASLKLASFLTSTLTPILTAIFGPVGTIAGLIISGLVALAPVLYNLGGDIMNGLFNGIGNVVKGIGSWIYNHIFKPFIDGFKKVFGIHSPSTVMAEQGRFIVEGILQGIKEKWTGLLQFWTEKKNELINKFNDIKEKFLTKGRNIVDGIKGGISEKWGDFSTFWGQKKDNIVNKFNDIRTKFGTKGREIVSGIKEGISNNFPGFLQELGRKKDSIVNAFSGIKNGMLDVGRNIVSGIIEGIRSAWDKLKGWANSIAEMFNINIKTPSVSTGASSSRRSARSVSEVPYSAISPLANAPIPYLATGAVIPPNKEFMAVLGDQKQGNNIEAPEALLRKIVREETKGMQGNRGGTYNFSASINRRVLFDEIIEEAKLRQTVSGRNAFELA